MEWRALRENNVFDGQVSSSPVVRDARPIVSNKIIWIHQFSDAETMGRRSVSFQGVDNQLRSLVSQPLSVGFLQSYRDDGTAVFLSSRSRIPMILQGSHASVSATAHKPSSAETWPDDVDLPARCSPRLPNVTREACCYSYQGEPRWIAGPSFKSLSASPKSEA
jgi:hypothetical protein